MSAGAEEPHRINLSWLSRLRWGAILGQLVTIAAVHTFMRIPLPLLPLGALIAFESLTNVAAWLWLRARQPVSESMIAAALAVDVAALTGLLFFTGGPFNPFSFLYLVHIALAAVVLRTAWTWALVALALAASGALFYGHVWLKLDDSDPVSHMQHMQMHLQGMWIAFAVAAGFIVHFVTRVQRALHQREADLAAERTLAERNARLASLATLSAGAAHELATPLGTIAVVARELERAAERTGSDQITDLRLIRSQIERCRTILDQMAADAGETAGELFHLSPIASVVQEAMSELPPTPSVELQASPTTSEVNVPVRALSQAIRGLIRNAQDAAGAQGSVRLRIEAAHMDNAVHVHIVDTGDGIPPHVLARVGEPFFTTKAPGHGMGLGVFLARTLIERLGGRFHIDSTVGGGTTVTLSLPMAPATTRLIPGVAFAG